MFLEIACLFWIFLKEVLKSFVSDICVPDHFQLNKSVGIDL